MGRLTHNTDENGAQYNSIQCVDELVHRIATSLGFGAVQQDGAPTIQLRFDPDERVTQAYETPLGRYETLFHPDAYGNIDEISLSPVLDVTPACLDEICDRLAAADSYYHARTRDGSKFYDLSTARQYAMFDSVTQRVHDATPSPAAGVSLDISVATPWLYYSEPLDGQPAKSPSEPGTIYRITGSVLGVSLINAWHAVRQQRTELGRKRLQRQDDLLDSDTGLCFVVEPHAETSHSPLYVPYSQSQFELSLRDIK